MARAKTALAVVEDEAPLQGLVIASAETDTRKIRAQIVAQRKLVRAVMGDVMQKDVHYGVIPGTQKPTLYKAGSEVLLAVFKIAVEPIVEDVSTADMIRYRVTLKGVHAPTGIEVGRGVGECSSNEEKYKWRAAVCQAEYEDTPDDRKRMKWKKGSPPYQVAQVRAEPDDIANTVLKMAKKRAQMDFTLTGLAASDVFNQDLEDMSREVRESLIDADGGGNGAPGDQGNGNGNGNGHSNENGTQSGHQQQTGGGQQPGSQAPRSSGGKGCITERQGKLIYARLQDGDIPVAEFLQHFGIGEIGGLPFGKMDEALAWIKG